MNEQIVKRIKIARVERGFTQKELGNHLGRSVAHLTLCLEADRQKGTHLPVRPDDVGRLLHNGCHEVIGPVRGEVAGIA